MKRSVVIWGIVVACGVGVFMLSHRQPATTGEIAEPSSVASVEQAELAPDQGQQARVEATGSVGATTAPTPMGTTGTFRGRLIDAVTRQPVKEFEVRMLRVQLDPPWRDEPPLIQTFQSDVGRFAWRGVPADNWYVTLTAHGYQRFDAGEVSVVAGKKTREVVMPLLRGFMVRGRVVAAGTGAAIPEAGVSYQIANGLPRLGVPLPDAKTNQDGSFVIDGIPGGDIVLTAEAQGYASSAVEIDLDEKTSPQELVLSVGGRIAGTVKTASGAPVQTSIVLESGDYSSRSESNQAGQFSFMQLPPGRYAVSANGRGGSARQEIVLGQDQRREDVALSVEEGRNIHGTLRGLRPEQFKRAYITLGIEAEHAFFSTRPNEQGEYTINGVPAGRARMLVMSRERSVEKTFDVPADRDLTLDIVFPAGVRLSGRVMRADKPAIRTSVWMRPADTKSVARYGATTSADGAYEIEGLPLGEYRVTADEVIERAITISGDTVLNFDIPSVQVSGRVVDEAGSVPIVGAAIQIRGTDVATALVRGYKATNHFGEFSLTGLEPGEIVLTVYMPGYALYREKISYGAPIKNKTIALRKSSGVEIRVQPVEGKEPLRVLSVGQAIRGNDGDIGLWIPLNREGVGSLPSALAGSKITIYGRGDAKPTVIEEWDGEPLELKL